MKRFLVAALMLMPVPASANDGQAIGQIIDLIAQMAHRHYREPPPEYLNGPPEEEGPPPGGPQGGMNAGPEILRWLDHKGVRDAFVTGRRDQDCRRYGAPSFMGGWGVVLKAPSGKPTSGVVCVNNGRMTLDLDR